MDMNIQRRVEGGYLVSPIRSLHLVFNYTVKSSYPHPHTYGGTLVRSFLEIHFDATTPNQVIATY